MLRLFECYFVSISSISVPSGSSMNAMSEPVGLSLKGSSVIVTFSLRSVLMVLFMSLISKARWSNRRCSYSGWMNCF